MKIAGTKDGSITAFAIDCHGTSGFTGGATVNLGLLPYVYLDAIPTFKRSHSVAFINAGSARAMRAPGHPQNCVLTEFAVDDLAAKLGIDPLRDPPQEPAARTTRRRRRPRRRSRRDATRSITSRLDIAAKLSGWKDKWHAPGKGPGRTVKHGIGMAMHTWGGSRPAAQPNECTVTIGQRRLGDRRVLDAGPRHRPADRARPSSRPRSSAWSRPTSS